MLSVFQVNGDWEQIDIYICSGDISSLITNTFCYKLRLKIFILKFGSSFKILSFFVNNIKLK